ncbi:hypothetical protein RIVM261_015680 [Rivularia sp. IAM M-261]|nr:hypothetical protein CAL7716_031980 [Calothrix sp. PCC 7716]GJD16612.1 hypothetical protein RIVM261_015680 [Rivularia sp. IAM M-261]
MAFFYSFTESLKQKWLQFFQANHEWISLQMQVESVYTPDGGKRPSSYLILGVANALEPKLAQLMLPFSKLNPDADTLVEVLGLHFDPNVALGNHSIAYQQDSNMVINESIDESLAGQESQSIEVDDAPGILTSGFETGTVRNSFSIDAVDTNEIHTMSLNGVGANVEETAQKLSSVSSDDDFGGDISFDSDLPLKNDSYNELEDLNTSDDDHGFSDVLIDVWSEETKTQQSEDGDFGASFEEDSEIARLFPNG